LTAGNRRFGDTGDNKRLRRADSKTTVGGNAILIDGSRGLEIQEGLLDCKEKA